MSRRRNNLRQLASRIVALQAKARALGLFTHDRELLECRKCGLLEDVTSTGQLITSRPQTLGLDAGFRFQELPQNRFRCPACGSMVAEINLRRKKQPRQGEPGRLLAQGRKP